MWEVACSEARYGRKFLSSDLERLARVPIGSSYELDVEVNSKTCNLRCIYCDFSTERAGYEDYPQFLMDTASRDHILGLIRKRPPRTIRLGGLGETTFHHNWIALCTPFLDLGIHTSMYSNFAKTFSWDEARTLARVSNLVVSIDTPDPATLARIRRKVRLSTILSNLALVRTAAQADSRPAPVFDFSCVVSTSVINQLDGLVQLAARHGISQIRFASMQELAGAPLGETRSVLTLPTTERRAAFEQLTQAFSLALQLGVKVLVAPDLLEEGRVMFEGTPPPEKRAAGCLMPWDHVLFHGNRAASFCCAGFGRIDRIRDEESMDDIRNSSQIVAMRRQLLEGKVSSYCRTCPSRLGMDQQSFVDLVSSRIHLRT